MRMDSGATSIGKNHQFEIRVSKSILSASTRKIYVNILSEEAQHFRMAVSKAVGARLTNTAHT